MIEIFGIPSQALFGQLLIGLINGSFYALLSLGLAVIFGMLNIINFSHGAQYMMGAFAAYLILQYSGLGYWPALIIAPILVGITGIISRTSVPSAAIQARPSLWSAAHVWSGFDLRGRRAQLLRIRRFALYGARVAAWRAESRLHVPSELSRLGHCGFARHLHRDLVCNRAHAARRVPARRHREPDAGARLRHQCAAHDHAHLRLRRGARRICRRDGGADLQCVTADGFRN